MRRFVVAVEQQAAMQTKFNAFCRDTQSLIDRAAMEKYDRTYDHCILEVCGNDFLVPIPFPLQSNHSHSHSRQRLYIDYFKAEKYVYCVVNSKQNMKLQQKHS